MNEWCLMALLCLASLLLACGEQQQTAPRAAPPVSRATKRTAGPASEPTAAPKKETPAQPPVAEPLPQKLRLRKLSAVHGQWKIDIDRMVDAMAAGGEFDGEPERIKQAKIQIYKQSLTGEMVFRKNRFTFSLTRQGMPPQVYEYTWRLVARKGQLWKIKAIIQTSKRELDGSIEWLDDDKLLMKIEDADNEGRYETVYLSR